MSTVKKNDIFTVGLSGGFGSNTVFSHRKGQTFAYPKRSGGPTEKQAANQLRFKAAADWAKTNLVDPNLNAEYAAIAKAKNFTSAKFAAIVDYVTKTELIGIGTEAFKGQAGFHMGIGLKDNYKGKEMFVSIANKDGTVIESGNASFTFGEDAWTYITTATYADISALKISVTVKDRIGRVSNFELVLA